MATNFVKKESIVREIWGKGDTILFIFAGASAEFALNKAVDWLYFTGKLPKDPLGRLFSTVAYARKIVFSDAIAARKAIENINAIHSGVETKRGKSIPDWAYRDVLFMLIDYSIRAYEIMERPLRIEEKEEVFEVFSRVGKNMKLKDLPETFMGYQGMRKTHIEQHLEYGAYTRHLYQQYRYHLGYFRYRLLIETQSLIVPQKVQRILRLRSFSLLYPFLFLYKMSRSIKLDLVMKSLILPEAYKNEIRSLDYQSN